MSECEQLGINAHFLQCIKEIYELVKMCVKVNQNFGEAFATERGTKQGDPMSPTLFGIFIIQLHSLNCLRCPRIGVKLLDHTIQELFYADEVTLLAHSAPDEPQQLLDYITLFAKLFDLKVNCAKTKIIVVRTRKRRSPDQNNFHWTIDGQQISTVT